MMNLGPKDHERRWKAAQQALRRGRVRIAHIDTGLAPHTSLGFAADGSPPDNIRMDEGKNYHDPSAGYLRPVADLRVGAGLGSKLTEFPDHGVKTLSVILSDAPGKLVGVARGAHVVPYRVANGPVFRSPARTACIGYALDDALSLSPPCRVASISMGNPGFLGPYDVPRWWLRGEIGMARQSRRAIDRAYEAGMIVVCAAGQIVLDVVRPAAYPRTIAVGGFSRSGQDYVHYPRGGYNDKPRVDVWALAVGVNRAEARLGEPTPHRGHASDYPDAEAAPSGTSYACPQVAAAAALWLERNHDELEARYGRLGERWRIVEAFRRAVRRTARPEKALDADGPGTWGDIFVLDVEALLNRPVDAIADRDKKGETY